MSKAQEMVDFYIDLEMKVAASKSTSFNGRSYTRQDLPEIIAARENWERRLITERSGGASHSLVRFV